MAGIINGCLNNFSIVKILYIILYYICENYGRPIITSILQPKQLLLNTHKGSEKSFHNIYIFRRHTAIT